MKGNLATLGKAMSVFIFGSRNALINLLKDTQAQKQKDECMLLLQYYL
jgi:hypothetical protein